MNPTDEYLNQIIEAQKKDKIDFDPSKYNIDDILNEDMDDELNMISDNNKNIKELQREKENFSKEATAEPAIEKENKRKSVNIKEKEEFIILPKYDNPIDLVSLSKEQSKQQKQVNFVLYLKVVRKKVISN